MRTKIDLTLGQTATVDIVCVHDLRAATVMLEDVDGARVDVCMPIALWRECLDKIAEELGAQKARVQAQMDAQAAAWTQERQ